MVVRLAALYVYPVKSCRGIAPVRWELDRFGLHLDRHWMVVDAAGRFLTQREVPRLALVETALEGGRLLLSAPARSVLEVPIEVEVDRSGTARERREVEVWRHRGPALDEGDAAAEWLAGHLGQRVRLVRLAPEHGRRVNPEWAGAEAHTAFSDGYPLLLLSAASLADLNQRLPRALPVERFRPNLVVAGCGAYAEDLWKRVRIGVIDLDVVKPCSRCAITTTDQATGERDGVEPLRTLAQYRKSALGVLFGQNCVHRAPGVLEIGMSIEVLAMRPSFRATHQAE